MAIFNMVLGGGGGGGGGYKTYNQLKEMSLSDALTELNTDAQGYYDNLNGNIRIYNNCFIGNDSNDGECKRNGISIIFYNGEWSSIDTSSIDTESIEIIMLTDSNGDLKIPVAGYNRSTIQDSPYNWKVSYDGGNETVYNGTGSTTPITIASGLTANTTHIIVIKPVIEDYGWALAFGFNNSGIAPLLQSIIYDGSYKGYGVSSTDTGTYFRYHQYQGCTSLTTASSEVLPNIVTSIGKYFRGSQYRGCTSLTTAPSEVLPNTVTSIGGDFRGYQYYGCTSLTTAPSEVLPNTVTSIGSNFRCYQYYGCTNLTTIEGWIDLSIGNSSYRYNQFYNCNSNKTIKVLSDVGYSGQSSTLNNSYVTQVQVPSAYLSNFTGTTTVYPRRSITDSKFVGY